MVLHYNVRRLCIVNKPQILVVEDDKAVRNLITITLETENYKYHVAENGEAAIREAVSYVPDIVILDLGLPDMDGIEIIKKIRTWSNIPIIVVSARSEDRDKIEALDCGADDYLTKPFSVEELLARLRVSLRRINYVNGGQGENSNLFINGDLKLDYAARCVFIKDEEIHLTPIEYRLICLLAKNVGRVLTHNFILKEVWGNTLPNDTPSLRVFMATLRKKIEEKPSKPKYIQTHIGIGYRMLRITED
nr:MULTISPECIES: response regulator transcription factor [Clostridium]